MQMQTQRLSLCDCVILIMMMMTFENLTIFQIVKLVTSSILQIHLIF